MFIWLLLSLIAVIGVVRHKHVTRENYEANLNMLREIVHKSVAFIDFLLAFGCRLLSAAVDDPTHGRLFFSKLNYID